MIDVHAHLCFPSLLADQEQIIAQAKQKIHGVIVSSANWSESQNVLSLVPKHPGFLFASIGFHPIDADRAGEPADALELTRDLLREHEKEIVAIGEVGLDFHWNHEEVEHEVQKATLRSFVALAEELQKPLILHSWDAEQECFNLVKSADVPAVIFHCYTGPPELAEEIVKAGFLVSISTNVLFSKKLRKIAKAIPLESLVLETDSPFLDPERERKRNTPENILLSAQKIAEIRGCSAGDVLEAAEHNAVKALKLKLKS